MASTPRISPLKEADLLIPDGEVRGEQLRQVFRRLFAQLNPYFDAIESLGGDISLGQNDRADLATALFTHNVPTAIRLKRLSIAKSAIIRACAAGAVPLGVPTVAMQAQAFPGAPATALVTISFSNPATTRVQVFIEMRAEGLGT